MLWLMNRSFRPRRSLWPVTTFLALVLASSVLPAQLQIPQIVQLPDDDFVYTWGNNASVDKRSRPDFTVHGVEQSFHCTLTGAFKPGSRMRDFYNLREFEQALGGSIYIVQEGVARMNDLDLQNQVDWGILDCIIPQTVDEEVKRQEKIDKAVDRAERQRDRRRAREEKDDN